MKFFGDKRDLNSGYIALTSAVVISALLIGITFTLSFSGFFARFNLLDSELKQKSLALAEACADTALLRLATNQSYSPSNDVISINQDQCTIVLIAPNVPLANQATIKTQAVQKNVTTILEVMVNLNDLTIASWQEVPN